MAARHDRLAIFSFIAADNASAAIKLDSLFEQKASQLPDMPSVGRKGRLGRTRELVVHPNYMLVYRPRPSAGVIEIIRVIHAAQKWP